jgi:site-specific DNA recombinase
MSPSFSSKNGVRYRFYVSSALLRGRKAAAGSVPRVSAQVIEQIILKAMRVRQPALQANDSELIDHYLLRAQLSSSEIKLSFRLPEPEQSTAASSTDVQIPWVAQVNSQDSLRRNGTASFEQPDHKPIQALVRAHRWADTLAKADFVSIEALAASVKLHPKVVRNEIKLAFLAPGITESLLTGNFAFGLPDLRKISALSWQRQLDELHQWKPQN